MNSVFSQMNDSFKNLSSDLHDVTNERDHLQGQVICLKNRLQKAEAQVEANEAITQEAQKVMLLSIKNVACFLSMTLLLNNP